ncbi:transcriptional regulator [alpha proteobacterium U9-1i]|nr:transcriptional regulator [alpha proteobacterium U9-1i]
MYVSAHFAPEDANALVERLSARHAALLISVGADGAPFGTHLPMIWDKVRQSLTGHIARANPHHTLTPSGRALAVLGGAEAYVSPGFYPSKLEHGKTVPTWNYEVVHLSGTIEWFSDAAGLEAIVRALSDRHERTRDDAWTIEDAPRAYIDAMLRAIVGVTLSVDKIEAKRKLSQNKNEADYDGVASGLERSPHASDREIAAAMRKLRAVADDPDGN